MKQRYKRHGPPGTWYWLPMAISVGASGFTLRPWTITDIDYSAANAFCATQFHRHDYFPHQTTSQPVYDARCGVYDDDVGRMRKSTLESCGFALHGAPTAVTDWTCLEQIRDRYLPELRELLLRELGEDVREIVFWNPILRSEEWSPNAPSPSRGDGADVPRGPVAGMAHLDTDMLAFGGETDELIKVIERNRIEALVEGQSPPGSPLDGRGRRLADALAGRRRFAVVNAWRSVDTESPILRAPLAVLATRYATMGVVPEVSPCVERSRWYTYPRMVSDEVMLFEQLDRSRGLSTRLPS